MEIKASMVKQLRTETGAGFADCKVALSECEGDFDKAKEWLSIKGSATAEKKSNREVSEGIIASAGDTNRCVLVEVLCETDFVASNDSFKEFANNVATTILRSNTDKLELNSSDITALESNGANLETTRTDIIGKIGENIQIGNAVVLAAQDDKQIYKYIHHTNKIGVIASVSSANEELGKNICMQVASMRPTAIDVSDFDDDYLNSVKETFISEMKYSNKPAEIKEKIIQGKLNKHLADKALLKQGFIVNEKQTVEQYLKENNATVTDFKALYI